MLWRQSTRGKSRATPPMHHTLRLGPGFPRCLPRSGTPQALLYLRLGQQRSRRHCDGGQAALRVAKSMCVAGHSGVCCGAVAVRWGRWCVPRRARADWCYIWNARLFSAPPVGRIARGQGGHHSYLCLRCDMFSVLHQSQTAWRGQERQPRATGFSITLPPNNNRARNSQLSCPRN